MKQTTLPSFVHSNLVRWVTLFSVALTMFFGHFFDYVMAPLESILTSPIGSENGMGMGWTSAEYGFFSGAYGLLNVYLFFLFFGGIILDKYGIRFAGILSTLLMFIGGIANWYVLKVPFEGSFWVPLVGECQKQVVWATLSFSVFGVGCEVAGITVNKVIVKWFQGHELALATGLEVSCGRLGMACAFAVSLPIAYRWGGVSASAGFGALTLLMGVVVFLFYCKFDRMKDAVDMVEGKKEEPFKFADLKILFGNVGFWCITFLCLTFYAGVFPFLKFSSKLMILKYHVDENLAGMIPAMLPLGTIFLTPFFGSLYDKYGKGATLMLLGAVLLAGVHIVFALPFESVGVAMGCMILLGVAFGLLPSAMWASVPKIIPMKLLGTAYAVIFYIQNIGLAMVPIWIGLVNERNTDKATGIIDYTETMIIFAGLGIVAILISLILFYFNQKKGYGLQLPNNQ